MALSSNNSTRKDSGAKALAALGALGAVVAVFLFPWGPVAAKWHTLKPSRGL